MEDWKKDVTKDEENAMKEILFNSVLNQSCYTAILVFDDQECELEGACITELKEIMVGNESNLFRNPSRIHDPTYGYNTDARPEDFDSFAKFYATNNTDVLQVSFDIKDGLKIPLDIEFFQLVLRYKRDHVNAEFFNQSLDEKSFSFSFDSRYDCFVLKILQDEIQVVLQASSDCVESYNVTRISAAMTPADANRKIFSIA